MMRILCLWLPNWPIQRAVRCRPELKGLPVALVVNGPRGSEVAACCSAAVAQGVRPGMPLVEAQSLARELGIAPYEPEADRAALVECAEACERFSPRVALEDGAEPESVLLDISNLEHLCGSETLLVEQVKKFFSSREYVTKVAVAETVGAAWAAAHFGFGISDCGLKDPNPQSEIRNPKFNLPVQSLRISEETAAMLRELGVETVGQLMALPRDELASRFGEELLLRLDQLTGRGREVIEPRRSLPALDASYEFEEPTGDRIAIMHVLEKLVEELARKLASRDQGAVMLLCLLRSTEGSPLSLRIGLLQPSANPRQLLELIELHLEATRLVSGVNQLELRAAIVGRLGERQGELFADRWPTDPHQLAILVNRLSSRLGYDRVLRAEPRASPVPERAVQWKTAMERNMRVGAGTRKKKYRISDGKLQDKEKQSAIHNPQSAIPLLLYPEPLRVEVVCVSPDGPPECLWLEGRREAIVECAGPDRIETLWWRGRTIRRDYYRATTESGNQLWMFRRLIEKGWFVHGIFA